MRRIIGLLAGAAPALAPGAAFAQVAERALDAPDNAVTMVVVTLLAVGALFLVAAIGYLYRRERNLHWDFQKPDAAHDEHH